MSEAERRHIDVERMVALAHGEVDADEAAWIHDHARECAECGAELAVLLALRLESDEEAETSDRAIAADVPGRGLQAVLAASIVFVLVLGSIWMSGILDPPVPDFARFATTNAPDALDVQFLFGMEDMVPASAADGAYAGFALIVDGRYGEAIEVLSQLNESDPSDGEVATGLGIALYLDGATDARAELLLSQGASMDRQDFGHMARWYLANLYLRRGDLARAMVVLEDISTQPDFPGTRALDLLDRLRPEGS